jgi:hypothetical protein
MSQEVVRVLLRHESHEMTAHYARITDQTVRRRWEAAPKVNIKGERVTFDPEGPLAQAQWAKTRYSIATQTLPNGYCGLPLQRSCPHANACLTCPVFLTGPEFLPELREQHRRTLALIDVSNRQGQTRMVEMNQQVLTNLERAVSTLRRMDKAGLPITFDAVAREAGVSRSWLYNQPDLRTEVERLRARRHPPTPHARSRTGNAPPTPPCSSGYRPPPSASSICRPKTASSVRRWPTRSVSSGPTPFTVIAATRRQENPPPSSAPADHASKTPSSTHNRWSGPRPCHQLQITSGRFGANSAWVLCAAIAHNLLHAAGVLAGDQHNRARGSTLRRRIVTVSARLARPQRRPILHLPTHWPWSKHWLALWHNTMGRSPPQPATP